MTTNITNEGKVLYPDLSYKIMGILFEVHNKLGTKYQEKHYQKAIEIKLKEYKLPYKREAQIKVKFGNDDLGEFFIDFIINNQIILETKVVWRISQNDIKQVLRYLKSTNLKLGIIANFKHDNLEFRRILN
ncbi:GxxExxY protein [Candidatus Wolfebacteria bacterium CG10_big_fil_rev_8_21_14_0_10_31_9]|uniref:GxxExxY protein n=1 Tax=Candidatus Wolfebacteria bacterium CG10_big_fil_rev_8_21_14_0_10_31_9 TaxID=1975070 RepID=A0A2H0RF05_9BACT|nr:MAG: GxxExxY protein [Candidatus Wolfebacteria bacterium CG10_big_fil_rev_8_21_14_0_10_31_9]